MNADTVDSLGIEDPGKWMSFCIDLDSIYAVKITADETDEPLYNCTTVYCFDDVTYVIDTPYPEFKKIFLKHKNQ